MVPKKIMDKLLALKKEDKFFSTALKANELDWNTVMQCLEIFKYDHPLFKGKFPSGIEFVSTLTHLEKLGLDYNSLDTYGNKFLDYAFEIRKSQGSYNIRNVSEEALDYIIKKTDNIYYLNSLNQNILFNFVEGYAGFAGKEFLKYAKEYNFDVNQIDIYGKTVFHYAVEKNSHISIAQYLVDKINPHLIDKKGKNLLFLFENSQANQDNIDIFDKLIKHVDLTQNDSKNNCVIDNLFKNYTYKSFEDKYDTKKQRNALYWLSHTLVKINQLEFIYTPESVSKIINIMEKHQDNYIGTLKASKLSTLEGDTKLFNDTLTHLTHIKLEHNLPAKGKSKHIKIRLFAALDRRAMRCTAS